MNTYARVGGKEAQDIYFNVEVAGGKAPYNVLVDITCAGRSTTYNYTINAEGSQTYGITPPYWGIENFVTITVTDANGKTQNLGSKRVVVAKDEREEPYVWDESVKYAAEMTGDWREDIVSIAITQLDYEPSRVDFRVYNGGYQYYSRYAHCEGMDYHEWCTPFIAFCARYAGIDRADLGFDGSVWMWVEKVKEMGAYRDLSYAPEKGDIIFLAFDGNENATHIGIVYDGGLGYAYTIEGNISSKVGKSLRVMRKEDAPENKGLTAEEMKDLPYRIVGYASMAALMENAGLDVLPLYLVQADEEIRDWALDVGATEEMVKRAKNAQSLDHLVLENNRLIYVRTGNAIAYVDEDTGYVVDIDTGLIVAKVEGGAIVPFTGND